MEYYIYKLFEQKKAEKGLGFNEISKKLRITLIGCVSIMICTMVLMVIFGYFIKQDVIYLVIVGIFLINSIILIISMLVFDKKDIKEQANRYKVKIEILNGVLQDYQMDSREKIEQLVLMYEKYIEKEEVKENRVRKAILTIGTIVASILTISFQNMGLLGVDLAGWALLASMLIMVAFIIIIAIYIDSYNSMKRKYENMIRDLKNVILLEY